MKPLDLTDILTIKSALRRYCDDHLRFASLGSINDETRAYHNERYEDGARMQAYFEEIEDRLIKSDGLRTSISVKL